MKVIDINTKEVITEYPPDKGVYWTTREAWGKYQADLKEIQEYNNRKKEKSSFKWIDVAEWKFLKRFL